MLVTFVVYCGKNSFDNMFMNIKKYLLTLSFVLTNIFFNLINLFN
ncbi:hypothetical protein PB1A_0942 [Leuconostoc inhae]|uniref:Mobile element protein n=1 Tax=Leuconostoc inhae TaxID=178001 RepID=A0ABP2BDJ8_9LACO|nr:hypothetical protein LEGAS_0043 [Leuconostoc gasicomitatum LMG 18811]CUR62631.1 Uncharacterized protein LEKG_0044 [Leuconostoc gasicomitatum KG16-1]CUW04893.1 hypothetical protein PB1A_0942 [Leuconostoc inhae]CUW20596.1 hypothetical protein KSL4_1870 [Leuconostoc inhae]